MNPRKTSRIITMVLVAAALVGLVGIMRPTTTTALPAYNQATGQACGVCHINPAGGGPRTAIGQAFEAVPTHSSDPLGAWLQVSSPTLTILSPTEGQVITGSAVTVTIQVTNFTLAPGSIGGANQPGQGHWHLILDGGAPQVVGTESFNLTGLTPGAHTIKAELHNNDHSPLSPPVEVTVNVTVAGPVTTRAYLPELVRNAGPT